MVKEIRYSQISVDMVLKPPNFDSNLTFQLYNFTVFHVPLQLRPAQLVVSSMVKPERRRFAGEGYSPLTMPARDDRVTQGASGARPPQASLSSQGPPPAQISLFLHLMLFQRMIS